MYVCIDGWMDECVCMYICMYVSMDGWMDYLCVYVVDKERERERERER